MKRLAALLFLLATTATAAGIPAPPHLLAMWQGRDGAYVRAFLTNTAASGDASGATASQRLDAGEAAYWLGVQHALAGRADSARSEWRRAMRLRGDFDEGFALIDQLASSRRAADLAEAHAIAGDLAQQASWSVPKRVVEAHARWAWTLSRLGRADSAASVLREQAPEVWRRALWTRRALRIQLAGGDLEAAWRSALMLAIRGRGQDREADSLLVLATRRLGWGDDRRAIPLREGVARALADERLFAEALGGRVETVRGTDGFPIQCFTFPAHTDSVRGEALLMILSPSDTLRSAEALVRGFVAAGSPVVLVAPRGSYGSRSAAALGPDTWVARDADLERLTALDARAVMAAVGPRAAFKGRAWVVAATGDPAAAALRVVEGARDVRALLLVAPHVPVVSVADLRARLRTLGTRTFVQVSPEEPSALEFADLLARDTAPGQVRVADTGNAGRGLAILGTEARIMPRLVAWLREGAKPR